ncbi:Methyltransferase domain-containing protein [Thermomonospora echinospora]|uniref:Methyltransferase domain-containing protein n=1 Tax=Thermomonospora echinospora TaxID=1992 RepID=A0A1H6E517_9ACTN|nr:class I SAM-dependent methyltransferase [Thermomonospora echinospora]SEG92309.1 Methyltransferase domain-containing protein [Thermomonospora echinospora]
MPSTTARARQHRSAVSPHVDRLVDFTEPSPADECLDLSHGRGPLPAALEPLVRRVTAVDTTQVTAGTTGPLPVPRGSGSGGRTPTVLFDRSRTHGGGPGSSAVRADACALPYRDGTFTLVTSRFSLRRLGDPAQVLREMVRVCRPGGRVVIAEAVRPAYDAPERDRLERLRDPGHPGLATVDGLTRLLAEAGAHVRRLERINVERPLEPWLADAPDPHGADDIRHALVNEVDGGPRTGARPRVIGGEMWFTQTWAYLAAEPYRR